MRNTLFLNSTVNYSTFVKVFNLHQYTCMSFKHKYNKPQYSSSCSNVQNTFGPQTNCLLDCCIINCIPSGVIKHDKVPAFHQPVCNAIKILLCITKIRVQLHCFTKIPSCFISKAHPRAKNDRKNIQLYAINYSAFVHATHLA